ncbi:hypothetical protein L1887_10214 [Cichorium endivia]|nr:hypothetical protein L1887_10214 [Cichorium endivia]
MILNFGVLIHSFDRLESRRFGYLQIPNNVVDNFTNVFDDSFEFAVVNYQRNLRLMVTGKLDAGTVSQIILPHCGVSDARKRSTDKIHVTKHYAYFYGEPRSGRSTQLTLTYAFFGNHMINYLSSSDVQDAFRRSFSQCSSVIPAFVPPLQFFKHLTLIQSVVCWI